MKKFLIIGYFFLVTILILVKEVYGYLDPSAMTYLIQITAAFCITIATCFGVIVYKIKRFFKNKSKELDDNKVKKIISDCLNIKVTEIEKMEKMKKGMTNNSYFFEYKNEKYIFRIPKEGTEKYINRKQEEIVYNELKGKNVCDEVIYLNSEKGYKISKFYENARECDSFKKDDISKCMQKLRKFHELELSVNHDFDIFERIEYYESIWKNKKPRYDDYYETKNNVLSLKSVIEKYDRKKVLCHIDAVSDNFLILPNDEVVLVDWEYAGMQDPHIDIAMFALYSMYSKEQLDTLIDLYFTEGCSDEIKLKIYCYMAVCGLVWSNWSEYKRKLGQDLGEYAVKQYEYAKEYFDIVQKELNKGENKCIQ